jgi:hypothetical protein
MRIEQPAQDLMKCFIKPALGSAFGREDSAYEPPAHGTAAPRIQYREKCAIDCALPTSIIWKFNRQHISTACRATP